MGFLEWLNGMTHSRRLKSLDLDGVADHISSNGCRKIVIMAGAGISVSAGIPDFRSLSAGIYNTKATNKYSELPTPQHMFDLDFFLENHGPFYDFFTHSLFPSPTTKPTRTHHFLKLLCEKELCQRVYTQNIDSLERLAGVPGDKILEVHGSLSSASCAQCHRSCDARAMAATIRAKGAPKCGKCGNSQKPDIVFFGEKLPRRVTEQMKLKMPDMRSCDLLIIMGTSLAVQPFASFIDKVPKSTPRVFMNKAAVGSGRAGEYDDKGGTHMFGQFGNYRDVLLEGECDKIILRLAAQLGWMEELLAVEKKFETEMVKNGGVVDVEGKVFGKKPGKGSSGNGNIERDQSMINRRISSPKHKGSGSGSGGKVFPN